MKEKLAVDKEVYFVYDGACPICNIAANGFRIKQAIGKLNLVDARSEVTHPIIKEIQDKGLNLDEGMVIKFGGRLYHGADALNIMAFISTGSGTFNKINVLLFNSKKLSIICYPILKSVRNLALRLKGVSKIHNLQRSQPIFQPIFGKEWFNLPAVLRKHYANFPYSNDVVTVEGKLDVNFGKLVKILSPFFRLLGALVPYQGEGVPVIVKFRSEPDSNVYCFDREFYFPNKPIYYFRSRIVPQIGNEAIEYMRFGIGWHGRYMYANNKILIMHKRYVWNIFGVNIPLPISLLLVGDTERKKLYLIMNLECWLLLLTRYGGKCMNIKEFLK